MSENKSIAPCQEVFAKADALTRLGGDGELLALAVRVFIQELHNMVSCIQRALDEKNPNLLQHEAHALKGAALNIGAVQTAGTALKLEKLGAGGDLTGSAGLFDTLKADLERLQPLLVDFVDEAGAS